MRRVLVQRYGFRIYSLPAMVYLGSVFGLVVGNYVAHLLELNALLVFAAMLILTVPAFVGGRLLFVATHWKNYHQDLARIWRLSEGGGSQFGGLPLTLIISLPLLSLFGLPFWSFWDVAAIALLAGMCIGRMGCVLNGCCGGRPTTSRLSLPMPDYRGVWCQRIPTQLLEVGSTMILLLGVIIMWDRTPFPGTIFLYALAGYGIMRFLLEPTRMVQDRVKGVSIYRVTSIIVIVVAITVFLFRLFSI